MMREFLTEHREELIFRCARKVEKRSPPKVSVEEIEHGIPLFLDQLIRTLRVEQTGPQSPDHQIDHGECEKAPSTMELDNSAARHGRELMDRGFTVEQVVHDYGDLCQAITELAFELNAPIGTDEFRTLNLCLDNGIAAAVTEFNYRRDFIAADEHAQALNERLGIFAHELRNYLNASTLALGALKAGNLSVNGATAGVLERCLVGMTNLVNRSLNEVRITAGLPSRLQRFSLADFIDEARLAASLEAESRSCRLTVESALDPSVALNADRDLLLSALGNLLQNAFKFTRRNSCVTLRAYTEGNRIRIDVEDQGFGLPPETEKTIFESFAQSGEDRSGLGLGLAIAKRGVEANEGSLHVRSQTGIGCVFTIDLPCHSLSESKR